MLFFFFSLPWLIVGVSCSFFFHSFPPCSGQQEAPDKRRHQGQQEVPPTGGAQDNRRGPGQQEVPVTTGGTPEQQEAPGTTGGAGTTGAPRTTGGNWDNCASSLCPDCAYLCFTQGGMGIFCTGRLLIVVLFLAALPWLIIVFVLLLLFFEILQTDCTTSIFLPLLPQDGRLIVFVLFYCQCARSFFFLLYFFSKPELFPEVIGTRGIP